MSRNRKTQSKDGSKAQAKVEKRAPNSSEVHRKSVIWSDASRGDSRKNDKSVVHHKA
jgi:hypothetical protein